MLTQSLAPFTCLCSFRKFSIAGLISGSQFSLLYKFSFFVLFFVLSDVIFSWVGECLENILAFFLKQDLVYSQQSLAVERLLYPWSRREVSYKIRFVCPYFRLPVSFLEIDSLVFSETYHNVRGPYIAVCDRAGFFGKIPHRLKMVKNGAKTWFLDFLRKLRH